MNKENIGNVIRDARIKAGYSQTELAKKLKIKPSTVSSWESGRISPNFENLNAVLTILNVSYSALENHQEEKIKYISSQEESILTLGEVLRMARKLAHITQTKLAAQIGVSQATIGSWERGDTEPSNEKIKLICNTLGLSACELLGLVYYQEDSHLYELIKMYVLLNKDGQKKIYSDMEDLLELPKYKK